MKTLPQSPSFNDQRCRLATNTVVPLAFLFSDSRSTDLSSHLHLTLTLSLLDGFNGSITAFIGSLHNFSGLWPPPSSPSTANTTMTSSSLPLPLSMFSRSLSLYFSCNPPPPRIHHRHREQLNFKSITAPSPPLSFLNFFAQIHSHRARLLFPCSHRLRIHTKDRPSLFLVDNLSTAKTTTDSLFSPSVSLSGSHRSGTQTPTTNATCCLPLSWSIAVVSPQLSLSFLPSFSSPDSSSLSDNNTSFTTPTGYCCT